MPIDLSGLRDIHLPTKPFWWPPAIGWWLIASIIIGLLILCIFMGRWWYMHPRQCALRELKDLYVNHPNTVTFARQVSILLKRIAILLYPRSPVATLSDSGWRSFLKKKTGTTFTKEQLDLLAVASYMPEQAITPVATDAFYTAVRQAINQLFERKNHGYQHTKRS